MSAIETSPGSSDEYRSGSNSQSEQSDVTPFASIDLSQKYYTATGLKRNLPQLGLVLKVIQDYTPSDPLPEEAKVKIAQTYLWVENPRNTKFIAQIREESEDKTERDIFSTLREYEDHFTAIDSLVTEQKKAEANAQKDTKAVKSEEIVLFEQKKEKPIPLTDLSNWAKNNIDIFELTVLEKYIAQLAIDGKSNTDIGRILGYTPNSIQTYISSARKKIETRLHEATIVRITTAPSRAIAHGGLIGKVEIGFLMRKRYVLQEAITNFYTPSKENKDLPPVIPSNPQDIFSEAVSQIYEFLSDEELLLYEMKSANKSTSDIARVTGIPSKLVEKRVSIIRRKIEVKVLDNLGLKRVPGFGISALRNAAHRGVLEHVSIMRFNYTLPQCVETYETQHPRESQ